MSLQKVTPRGELPSHVKVVLAVEIVVAYVRTRWLLWRLGDIQSVVSTIRAGGHPARTAIGRPPGEARVEAMRLAHAVRRTLGVLPADSRCLQQSLVLLALMSARAMPGTVVIGAHAKPRFDAHAWIEYEGWPVLPLQDFASSRLVAL